MPLSRLVFFSECLQDIFGQVEAMAYLKPSRMERATIAHDIEYVLHDIKPYGVMIQLNISHEKLLRGEFVFREIGNGIIEVI